MQKQFIRIFEARMVLYLRDVGIEDMVASVESRDTIVVQKVDISSIVQQLVDHSGPGVDLYEKVNNRKCAVTIQFKSNSLIPNPGATV